MFYDKVLESAEFIKSRIPRAPTVGIVLGSGLGSLVDVMEDKTVLPYRELPGFPQSHLEGHAGNFVFGRIGAVTVAAMQGRFHYYEGFDMKELTCPIYVMKLLGVESLIVTNAAGGINPGYAPGDLMILSDYINLMGRNSLIGPNDERFGPRFPDMSEAYSRALISRAEKAAEKLGLECRKGVYLALPGPCFETAAEIRAFAVMGADAVGMSTVPETIAANYLGMKVFGLSCITNMATGISAKKHSHQDVLRIANESSEKLCSLVKQMLADWKE